MGHVFSSGHSLAGYHFHLPTFLRACRLGVSGWFCFRICSWLALSLREAFGWLGRVWFPPSFGCDFPFPPSFVPSFLLLPSPGPDSCYDGLVKISSGDVDLVLLSKSRCNGSGHLLQVRTGQKACSRSFLRWCDFFFLFAFVTTRGRTGMTGRQSVPGLEGPAASDPLLGSWLVPSSPFSS